MRFKVGDLIKGKPNSLYSITNNKSICKVLMVNEGYNEDLTVEVIKYGTYREAIGKTFSVESRYFIPVLSRNYIEA